MNSQIINFKTIGEVVVLGQCYQCGGETLGPVRRQEGKRAKLLVCSLRKVPTVGHIRGIVTSCHELYISDMPEGWNFP